MQAVTLYLISNPFIAIGLGLLVLLCVYNILRRQLRVVLMLWLVIVAVLFYVHVQVNARQDEEDVDIVAPPPAAP